MFEKLEQLEIKYEEMTRLLSDPEILADTAPLSKACQSTQRPLSGCREVSRVQGHSSRIADTKQMIRDEGLEEELRKLAKEELVQLEQKLLKCGEELKVLLLPKESIDEKNVLLEIRAGTGGDEASLFAQEMFRMLFSIAESQGWRVDVISSSVSGVGV